MIRAARHVLAGLAVTAFLACGGSSPPPNQMKATWVAVADWMFEVGDLRIYMDGALTRFDPTNFFGGGSGLSFSKAPVCFAKDTDQRVLDALGAKPNFIITGHSNLDHSYDSATIAKMSGAKMIGSQSTCLQAQAQGIAAGDCTKVVGGEAIDLGNGVHVRVVRWNHSGNNTSNPDLHAPLELTKAPTPDANGCFKPGVQEDFPNGGGGRGYLFTAGQSGSRFTWFFVDTGSDVDFDQPVIDNVGSWPSPKDSLIAGMAAEHLTGVDLWIGPSSLPFAQAVIPILHPKAFMPNHLGSFNVDFFRGNTAPYSNTALTAFLQAQNVNLLIPNQYMDGWTLSATGISVTPNTAAKAKLGFAN